MILVALDAVLALHERFVDVGRELLLRLRGASRVGLLALASRLAPGRSALQGELKNRLLLLGVGRG